MDLAQLLWDSPVEVHSAETGLVGSGLLFSLWREHMFAKHSQVQSLRLVIFASVAFPDVGHEYLARAEEVPVDRLIGAELYELVMERRTVEPCIIPTVPLENPINISTRWKRFRIQTLPSDLVRTPRTTIIAVVCANLRGTGMQRTWRPLQGTLQRRSK